MKFFNLIGFILLLIMLMNPTLSKAKVLAPHLHKTTLDNGLTIIVKETPGKKAAAVQIWVKAGSIYEDADEGGITHVIEHMIFKGTPTRGPGEIAGAIEEVGGRINAYTSYENTVYYATLSSRYWELAFDVLSDAVLHSVFDPEELEREKKVVLEEIGMRNDKPTITLFQQMMSTAYQTHPYRLPIIGTAESVSSFTRQDILDYMEKHYSPENFTVIIVGDVQVDQVISKVSSVMGDIPPGNVTLPPLPQETEQKSPRLFTTEDDINQSHLALAFPITAFSHPDSPVLDVISGILGQNDSSRLYHELRDNKQLVYRIDTSAFTLHDPGLFEITATLDPDKVSASLEGILEEVFKLKYLPVDETEIDRVKRNLESEFVFNLERVEGQARILGSFNILTGDPREDDYLNKIRAVTKEDIQRVAAKYFTPQTMTCGVLVPVGSNISLTKESLMEISTKAENKAEHGVPASLLRNAYLANVHQFRLPNGIKLLVREDQDIPTVAVRVVFPGGLRSETESTNGAFAFISDLLSKGTENLNAHELAVKIADMAGEIAGFNGKNTFGFKADFLSRFFEDGMTLLAEVIRSPGFDPEEAEKIRLELLDQLKNQEDSLTSLAFREFNRLLFQGHPYGLNTAGSETAIKQFTVAELKALYKKHARPDRMVIAVAGAVKAEEVKELVNTLFGDWQAPQLPESQVEVEHLPPNPPPTPEIFTIEKDKQQVHIIIGFLGTYLSSEDRFGIEVLDTILSGQSGRLFTELRDKQSLAYSLSSFSLLGLDTGSIGIYIGTSPEKKDAAIQAVWQEIYKISEQPVSDAELQRAKNVLISNYELGLQTHGSQAMEMALNETYELGQNFGKRYVEELAAITPEEVLEIARKYLLPNNYVLVSVGASPATAETAPPAATGDEPAGNTNEQGEE